MSKYHESWESYPKTVDTCCLSCSSALPPQPLPQPSRKQARAIGVSDAAELLMWPVAHAQGESDLSDKLDRDIPVFALYP